MELDGSSIVGACRVLIHGLVTSNRCFFFFSSRRRHTRLQGDWSSDVCSSDLGASLDAPPASGPRASRFASPESYTPTHLAERILTSKSAMEGERKQVTVLFAEDRKSVV